MFISNNSKKGAGLTEVLFSVFIISTAIAGILVIFVQTIDASKRISYEYNAINLAKSRIERARTNIAANGFSSLIDLDESGSPTILDADGAPDQDGDFKRETTVTTNYNGDSRLTSIEVSIFYKYKDEWRDSYPIEIATILTDIQ